MRLTFQTYDYHDALRLMNEIPPAGIKLEVKTPFIQKSFDAKNIAEFVLDIDKGVAIALIARWLFVKLKNSQSKTITIQHKEIVFEEGEISRVIEETTRIEQ